jgi:hypothetical protein
MHKCATPEGEEVHEASGAEIIGPDLSGEIYRMLAVRVVSKKTLGIIAEEREDFLKYFDMGGISAHVPHT